MHEFHVLRQSPLRVETFNPGLLILERKLQAGTFTDKTFALSQFLGPSPTPPKDSQYDWQEENASTISECFCNFWMFLNFSVGRHESSVSYSKRPQHLIHYCKEALVQAKKMFLSKLKSTSISGTVLSFHERQKSVHYSQLTTCQVVLKANTAWYCLCGPYHFRELEVDILLVF